MGPEGYGDCGNVSCLDSEQCIIRQGGARAVCAYEGCEQVEDCTTAPPGGTSTPICVNADTDELRECVLPCFDGQTCPDGMRCEVGGICMWEFDPTENYGFKDCLGGTLCLPGETCVTDSDDTPTYGVCVLLGCETPADCPLAPDVPHTADVLCGERLVNSDMGECFLDCSEGQTCPAGMQCAEQPGVCAFPI